MSERSQTLEAVAVAALFGAIMVLTVFGFVVSREWMPPVASAHAAGMNRMIGYLLWTTGLIFVVGHLVLIRFVWQYARGKDTKAPNTSPRFERMWSIVPVIGMTLIAETGVLAIGLPVWGEIHGAVPDDALVIEVTGRQFEWLVRYPGPDGILGRVHYTLIDGESNPVGLDADDPAAADDIVLRNRLHIPLDRPTYLRLRSHDVLHSFSVAAFRVKQDIVPGMVGGTLFTPTMLGTYEIGCAELCGLAHYRMRGLVEVHTPADYDQWLSQQEAWLR